MNLLTEFKSALDTRVRDGTLSAVTRDTYLTDAAKVLEALVGMIPVDVVQAYVEAWGAKGDYRTVIRDLAEIAQERRRYFQDLREGQGAA